METLLRITLLVAVVAGLCVAPAAAQEESGPDVTLAAASVDVEAGDASTVSARYEFDIASAGTGESSLTAIDGTLWLFPGHDVDGVSATVNGEEVSPELTRHERYIDLAVPVEDASEGTVTVALEYEVQSSAGELKAPLWVPAHETGGTDRVVDLTVSLPDGAQVHGASFPKIDARSDGGSTLRSNLLHVPGFVSLSYGDGAGSMFTLDTLLTVFGLAFIVGFLGLWVAYTRGFIGKGRENNVA